MKKSIFCILCLCSIAVHAQNNIDGLVNAEKSFAAYSVAHGTKEAFLNFIDSAGIVFDKGKPVNGMMLWSSREKNAAVLNWRPQFAEIAASGDFGFTTGPWTFQQSANDSIIARGQFVTVWHTDKNGQWKFLVDLGVSNTPVNNIDGVEKISHSRVKFNSPESEQQKMISAEKAFISIASTDIIAAHQRFLSTKSIIIKHRSLPAFAGMRQKIVIDSLTSIQFEMIASGIASSADIGYVYGTTIVNSKPENYLHIWRKEGIEWKLALEVLRF